MKRLLLMLILGIALTGFSPFGSVQAEELTAKEIWDRAQDIQFPTNSKMVITMTLINKRGEKRIREFQLTSKEYENSSKALVRFIKPPDVRGTGFLAEIKDEGEAEAFIYLPALRKSRRISSSERNQSFMGSDFSYSDIQLQRTPEDTDEDDTRYKLLGTETVGKTKTVECYKIENIPVQDEDEQYSKIIYLIRKDNLLPVKAEFYDKHGKIRKQLFFKKVKKIGGKYLMPTEMAMQDVKKKHKTVMEMRDIEVDIDIPEDVFTKRNLEKE